MLKYLGMFAVVSALAIPAMATQYQQPGDKNAQQGQGNKYQVATPAPTTPNSQPSSPDKQNGDNKPYGWHKLVAFPEGITAWAIMLTLGAIVWQAWETRKSADASKAGAEAALIQSKLQAAVMKQWIGLKLDNLQDFGEERNSAGEFLPSRNVELHFQIINSTPYPFKIKHVKMGVNGTGEPLLKNTKFFEDKWNATIPPLASDRANVFTFRVPLTLGEEEYASYMKGDLNLSIFGVVSFQQAAGPMDTYDFALSYKCRRGHVTSLPVAPKLNPSKAFELKAQNEQHNDNKPN